MQQKSYLVWSIGSNLVQFLGHYFSALRGVFIQDWERGEQSLPETPKLPSVPTFAVGTISGTRQTWCLPSVPKTTLGKHKTHGITVYTECLHSAQNRHTATSCPVTPSISVILYAECQNTTLGKHTSIPSITF